LEIMNEERKKLYSRKIKTGVQVGTKSLNSAGTLKGLTKSILP